MKNKDFHGEKKSVRFSMPEEIKNLSTFARVPEPTKQM
jgi:hypothetical protein